jgi:hypothetical protein
MPAKKQSFLIAYSNMIYFCSMSHPHSLSHPIHHQKTHSLLIKHLKDTDKSQTLIGLWLMKWLTPVFSTNQRQHMGGIFGQKFNHNLIYISNFKINFIILLNKIDNNYKIFIKLQSALRYTMVLYQSTTSFC